MRIKACILFPLFLSTVLYSTIIHIPDDYATIQEGIDAASNGGPVSGRAGTKMTTLSQKKIAEASCDGKIALFLSDFVIQVGRRSSLTKSSGLPPRIGERFQQANE